jgi:hypothetical protein
VTRRPHDALFKAGFEQPSHIDGLYCGSYPPTVYNRVDWSSTRPEPTEFIGEVLDDKHSDLLFSARLRPEPKRSGGLKPNGPKGARAAGRTRSDRVRFEHGDAETRLIYLYLLLEHQSTNDGDMPLRIFDSSGPPR